MEITKKEPNVIKKMVFNPMWYMGKVMATITPNAAREMTALMSSIMVNMKESKGEIPWTPFNKEVRSCKVSMISTSGLHLKSQKPFDTVSPTGDLSFREIPPDISQKDVMISHSHVDNRDAEKDFNIVFPLDRFKELVKENIIKELGPLITLMGFIPLPERFLKETVPHIIKKIKDAKSDFVFISPT